MKPSIANLGDSKYSSRNADLVLGLFSPFRMGLREYEGYDITKFRDNIRFLEVLVNRNGQMGGICPLFFDGAVCHFEELPRPDDKEELKKVYNYLDKIRNSIPKSFFSYSSKKSKNTLCNKRLLYNFARKFIKY